MAITSVPHENDTGGNGYNAVTWGTEELGLSQQLPQLGDIRRDPPRLAATSSMGGRASVFSLAARPASVSRRSKLTAPDFDRLARIKRMLTYNVGRSYLLEQFHGLLDGARIWLLVLLADLLYCHTARILLSVDLQQGVRDPRLYLRLPVEFANQALGNMRRVDIQVVLDRDIDLRSSRADVASEPGMGFERLPQRI
jgi:hypothetical protein